MEVAHPDIAAEEGVAERTDKAFLEVGLCPVGECQRQDLLVRSKPGYQDCGAHGEQLRLAASGGRDNDQVGVGRFSCLSLGFAAHALSPSSFSLARRP